MSGGRGRRLSEWAALCEREREEGPVCGAGGRQVVWHRQGATRGLGRWSRTLQDLSGPGKPQNPAQDAPTLPGKGTHWAGPTEAGGIKLGQKKIPAWISDPTWNGLAWPEVGLEKLEARLSGGMLAGAGPKVDGK